MEYLLSDSRMYYVIWMAAEEQLIQACTPYEGKEEADKQLILSTLGQFIDTNDWFEQFSDMYSLWMSEDDTRVYDINSELNTSMLTAIKNANTVLIPQGIALFYWFDVDVSLYPDWIWETDPIDHNPLVNLGERYSKKCRIISPQHFMVFPDNVDV